MPFSIIRNDITRVSADAIVNTANPHPVIGSGTDRAIYTAAGEEELLAERRKIGDILPGSAVATPAFALDAKYIIHTVGPAWAGGDQGERETLRSCYEKSLSLASELKCESIAFPLIATGVYGFPRDLAISTATSVIYDFLMRHEMMVYLVVFDSKAYDLSSKIFQGVQAYIDENYVSEKRDEEYDPGLSTSLMNEREEIRQRRLTDARRRQAEDAYTRYLADEKPGKPRPQYISLSEHMKSAGKSFNECLVEYINKMYNTVTDNIILMEQEAEQMLP